MTKSSRDTLLLFFVKLGSLNTVNAVCESSYIIRTCRASLAFFTVPNRFILIAGLALLGSFIKNWGGRGALAFIVN